MPPTRPPRRRRPIRRPGRSSPPQEGEHLLGDGSPRLRAAKAPGGRGERRAQRRLAEEGLEMPTELPPVPRPEGRARGDEARHVGLLLARKRSVQEKRP